MEEVVYSAARVLELMTIGEANRHVAATNMNYNSSRSHTLFKARATPLPPPLPISSLPLGQGVSSVVYLPHYTPPLPRALLM